LPPSQELSGGRQPLPSESESFATPFLSPEQLARLAEPSPINVAADNSLHPAPVGRTVFDFEIREEPEPPRREKVAILEPIAYPADVESALEVVLRHQFERHTATKTKAQSFHVRLKDRDATPAFLARFAGHVPPVRPLAEFNRDTAIRFEIDDWKEPAPDQLLVQGSQDGCHGGCKYIVRYLLVRKEARWSVHAQEIVMIFCFDESPVNLAKPTR